MAKSLGAGQKGWRKTGIRKTYSCTGKREYENACSRKLEARHDWHGMRRFECVEVRHGNDGNEKLKRWQTVGQEIFACQDFQEIFLNFSWLRVPFINNSHLRLWGMLLMSCSNDSCLTDRSTNPCLLVMTVRLAARLRSKRVYFP